ncbi:MAG: type II toxin-antitoxin system CcdA family antitoxin [Acidimicrobiia bacterium]|nr:type II toxin-antitoxin system CcdA family antitoxin [Acidimicrobiia bacterium]
MTTTKRKVSVSLDEELVAELEAGGEALSSQVNDAVRSELARRRRQRLLDEMLEEYQRIDGPPDEALVAKYMDLLA